MISMRMIQKISLALPNCFINPVDDMGRMYITDKKGVLIGDIDAVNNIFTIYEEYEFVNQVVESLESQGEKARTLTSDYLNEYREAYRENELPN